MLHDADKRFLSGFFTSIFALGGFRLIAPEYLKRPFPYPRTFVFGTLITSLLIGNAVSKKKLYNGDNYFSWRLGSL